MDTAAAKKATLEETRENLQLMANWAGTLHRERDAALEALEEAQALLQRWRYAEGGAEQEQLYEETMVALGERGSKEGE